MAHQPAQPSESITLTGAAGAMWGSAKALVGDVAELAAVEARMAGTAAAAMFGLGVGIAFCVMTAWLLLWITIALWLADAGLSWPGTLLIVAAVNLVAAVVMAIIIKVLGRRLTFSSTRRAMGMSASNEPTTTTPARTGS